MQGSFSKYTQHRHSDIPPKNKGSLVYSHTFQEDYNKYNNCYNTTNLTNKTSKVNENTNTINIGQLGSLQKSGSFSNSKVVQSEEQSKQNSFKYIQGNYPKLLDLTRIEGLSSSVSNEANPRFFIIKSFTEEDIHKVIKLK